MVTLTYPDGTIEFTASDGYAGPDAPAGSQRVGSALWYRVDGGPWLRSPLRSLHKTMHPNPEPFPTAAAHAEYLRDTERQ